MTLKQLEALYWAGALGSFASAAERLSMTQSSLSKRILELEEEIGQPLFDRTGPRARLTDLGRRLHAQAQQMLALRDGMLTTARGKYGLAGVCRFGVSELVASTWLAALVARVREAWPEVTLEPRVGVTQELLSDVLHGNTDFALGPGGSADAGIASRKLNEVEMIWVCAPAFLPPGTVLTARTLQEHPVISTTAQSGATTALETWAVGKGLKLRRIVASNSMGAVAALSASGLGLCLLPAPFARDAIERGRLRRLAVEPGLDVPMLPYYLHWRRDDAGTLSQAVRGMALEVGGATTFAPAPPSK